MLITRLITAVVLIPLVVLGILKLPTQSVALILAGLLAIGAWEWAGLARVTQNIRRVLYVAAYAAIALGIVLQFEQEGFSATPLLVLSCLWWLVAATWLRRFPQGWGNTIGRTRISSLIGWIALWATVTAVLQIHGLAHGGPWLLVFFVLIWGADSGAYFVGKFMGKHKLAPNVSPGKTIEGCVGGLLVAGIAAGISGYLMGLTNGQIGCFIGLSLWVAAISVVGDLTLSMFKRHAQVKDSGHLFPGHGGVLDRLDSTLAAAPWYALGLTWLLSGPL